MQNYKNEDIKRQKKKKIYDCHIANSHKRVGCTKNSFEDQGTKVTKLNIKGNW